MAVAEYFEERQSPRQRIQTFSTGALIERTSKDPVIGESLSRDVC